MSQARYVSDVKLCLELLARCEIYPNLQQLEQFLADEAHGEILNQCAFTLKAAWQNSTTVNPLEVCQSCAKPENSVSLEKYPDTDLSGFENLEGLAENSPESESVIIHSSPEKPPIRFKLPNATVNKPYQEPLVWSETEKITVLAVNGLENLSLIYDVATNSVSGEPKTAGEYRLNICYQQNDDAAQATQNAELSLVINSDPKSLWKNLPSHENLRFWKADSDFQGKIGLYNWKLAAASKRGRSHAHVGSCRDDDFALKVDNESLWQFVAVADGAGSCEFSREGAKIAAQNSVDVLSGQFQQVNPLLDELINRWQLDKSLENETALQHAFADIFSLALSQTVAAIESLAAQQQIAYREFYSTLLIAAHKTFPNGEFTVAYWIGDGGLGVYRDGQGVELLGNSDSGEYAGQTRFLDAAALERDDILQRLRLSSHNSFTALILMTDGITDPLFETDNNLRDLAYWQKLWQQLQPQLDENPELSAQNITDWLDFWSPGNHDDRTIALIYR